MTPDMNNNANFFSQAQPRLLTTTTDHKNVSPFAAMLDRYWRAFRRHLPVVAAIVVFALVVAAIATLLAVPKYTASARIEITREAAKITSVEGVEPERQNEDIEFYQTQYSLLTARSVAERVAGRLNVVSNDRLFDAFDFDIDQQIRDKNVAGGAQVAKFRLDKATDLLLEHVSIRPIPGSRLVDVAFTSPSAELSFEIANLWVDQFQESAVARRYESTSDARDFLEKQLADMRAKLEESQRRLVNYAAANEIVILSSDTDDKGHTQTSETLRTSDLKALNQSLAVATAQRIAAQSQAGQAGSPNQVALANVALNTMREQRAQAAADLARESAIFEPEYPSVQALQAKVNALDRSIQAEEARIRQAATSSYREAAAREQQLRDQVGRLKAASIGEQRASIQYAIYQREVDTNRELYEGLLQRYKEIGVAGVGANNISVVDHAVIPEFPTSPSLPLNLAIGLLFGLALAGGYVFVREEIDQSVKDPSDVTELFDLPLLGAIPQPQGDEKIEVELLDIKAPLSEAYFSAASNLSFLTQHGAPRSIAVTSTRPNEGKSTSAYALAIAIARTGARVLLIDCDLRNPSLHEHFGAPKEPGLSNLLSGGDPTQMSRFVVETGNENLSFIPAGPVAPNPGTLLIGDGLSQLVKQAGEQFDLVIVDGPPMLGLADAPLMAKAVEGVIYTIEANGMRARAIETGLNRLRFSGANIFGALVTKLNANNSAYGYGYGYGYGYSYGDKNAA
jgi:capsular exopolysaccharide synthesis family protein